MTSITRKSISYADAVRFLEALTSKGACPMCGTNLWNISTKSDDSSVCLLTPTKFSEDDGRMYDLTMDCDTCGYVRHHRTGAITKWLEANPNSEESKGEL